MNLVAVDCELSVLTDALVEAALYVDLAWRQVTHLVLPQNVAKREEWWDFEPPSAQGSLRRWFGEFNETRMWNVWGVLDRLKDRLSNGHKYGYGKYTLYCKSKALENTQAGIKDMQNFYNTACAKADAFAVGDGSQSDPFEVYTCASWLQLYYWDQARLLVHEFLHHLCNHQDYEGLCSGLCGSEQECQDLAQEDDAQDPPGTKATRNNDNYGWFTYYRYYDYFYKTSCGIPSLWK